MVFRGRTDVAFLLAAVFASVTEIRWIEVVGESTPNHAHYSTAAKPVVTAE